MAPSRTLYVGRDVQKESIAIASVAQDHGAEVVALGTIGTRQCAIAKLIRRLQSTSPQLGFVYAAGPGGSWLSRSLTKQGFPCGVVAPSLLPTKTGARVTTDRRDAMPRARRMRAGDLTPVSLPAVDDAAIRDLSRARAETLRALQAAKLRRKACVLRHASRSTGRATGRPAHRRWRSAVVGPTPAPQIGLQADVQPVTAQTARLGRLARARPEPVKAWRFAPVAEALQALRGVQGTVAGTMGAARGALTRFAPPRQRRHELGLTPAEYASGARRPPGSLTKTGHPHARRALVAGAWAYRYPATVRRHLPLRLDKLPTALQASSGQAQGRLCTRSRHLRATGTKAQPVVGAMARELRALLWAMATHLAGTPQASRRRLVGSQSTPRLARLSAEAQPRCGATRGSVPRPHGTRGPRRRPAPDGGTAGGSHPTASSVLNRRV